MMVLNHRKLAASLVRDLAERGGFEPPVRFYPYNALAKRRYRPLSHLSETGPPSETRRRQSARRISSAFVVVDRALELFATLGNYAQPDLTQVEESGQRIVAPCAYMPVT